MSILYHAMIVYSCPCGQDHTVEMQSAEQAAVGIISASVVDRLGSHSPMVRLTTWQSSLGEDGLRVEGPPTILILVDGEPLDLIS